MKKHIITAYILLLSFATIFSLYIPKSEVAATEETVIPNEAIRLRILANSDSNEDQALKRKVRDAVNAEITLWVQDLTSLEAARTTIKAGLPDIQKIAEQIVAEENAKQTVKVEFGKVNFPTKLYGQFLYSAGEYEAILITLGEGKGANWWCVLFPPLCFLDFSNGVAVSEGFEGDKPNNGNNQSTEKIAKAEAPVNTKNQKDELDTERQEAEEESTQRATYESETEQTQSTETLAAQTKATTQKEKVTESNSEATQEPLQYGQKVKAAAQVYKMKATEYNDNHNTNNKATENNTEKSAKPLKTAAKSAKTEKPVYTSEDEQQVKVKFFIAEIWTKIF
ncbi:stage II sporulation protein R [Bacillus sp. T3]|uniref:stage II sporulation protein R n=1 Tax=Bacillus sp. T3 TaxID=467262 RepID=UPI0029820EFC|nr:stage II sporulation protein R [Bacillus sp. T3]